MNTPDRIRVHFVGAGPGDPDLLTVKAQRLIRQADLIVYAGSLVPASMLNQAKPKARIHDSAGLTLAQTHALMRDAALAGQDVVRLHTGDPGLYGAVQEQTRLLEAEGIAYAVVPGVTAAMAAAAAARVSLTIPETRQTLILTRVGGRTPVPPAERLAALAAHQTALAIYLSGASHHDMARELLAGGYPPDTTIIVAHAVGWPTEHLQRISLDNLASMQANTAWSRQTVFLVLPGRDTATSSRLYAEDFSHGFRKPGDA